MVACILHEGRPNSSGYGRVGQEYAHRVAYERANGPIPDGLCVLHSCDVRMCVNTEHLFLGDHNVNMQDMKNKGRGRGARGEANGKCKLSDKDVAAIRASELSPYELRDRYKVHLSHIYRLLNGEQR